MKVQFFTTTKFHGKLEAIGSTYIRVNQVIDNWDEASLYRYGDNPDALIFQKVYVGDDYKFPVHFEGIKILDICDPDWLDGMSIVETVHAMDAVTCPTEALANYIRQFHKNVIVVPDRFDLKRIPKPIKHTKYAKTVVWFGYSHNSDPLKPAMKLIEQLGLNLIIISNDDPLMHRWTEHDYKDKYKYIKYVEETFYEELQKADFVILPDGLRPIDVFKSNNRTVKAILAGLPVAKAPEDVELFMDPKKRQNYIDTNYAMIAKDYAIEESIKQYKDIIKNIKKLG